MKTNSSLLEAVGETPVIQLNRVLSNGAFAYGKYEAANPSYSLKDRVAVALIQNFKKKNPNHDGKCLVVASNGNTALALALVCSIEKIPLHIFMSAGTSKEKQIIPRQYGAKVHLIRCQHCFSTVVEEAQKFVKETPGAEFIDQFDNDLVVKAHEEGTAEEIVKDFPDGVDAFVMSVGTGGLLTGVGRVLKQRFPQTKIYAVEPTSSAVLSGHKAGSTKLQQIGLGFIPENLDRSLIDDVITVDDEDAYKMTKRLASEEGLLLGLSSGANVVAALSVAERLKPGQKVLTVFCDQGQRYFSLDRYFKNQNEEERPSS